MDQAGGSGWLHFHPRMLTSATGPGLAAEVFETKDEDGAITSCSQGHAATEGR
jgi:hypothetical protein